MILPQGGPTPNKYPRPGPIPLINPPTASNPPPSPGPIPLVVPGRINPSARGLPQAGARPQANMYPAVNSLIQSLGFNPFGENRPTPYVPPPVPGEMPDPNDPANNIVPPGGVRVPPFQPTSQSSAPFSWPPAGPSAGPTDTVPAWLSPGEAVLNKNAAQIAGRGNIDSLNKLGQAVTGYATGGVVVDPSEEELGKLQEAERKGTLTPEQMDLLWRARQMQAEFERKRAMNEKPVFGFADGIGYVDPKDVDPAWQDVQLTAPHIDVEKLRQAATKYGVSPSMIQGLLKYFQKYPGPKSGSYAYNPSDWSSNVAQGYAYGGFPYKPPQPSQFPAGASPSAQFFAPGYIPPSELPRYNTRPQVPPMWGAGGRRNFGGAVGYARGGHVKKMSERGDLLKEADDQFFGGIGPPPSPTPTPTPTQGYAGGHHGVGGGMSPGQIPYNFSPSPDIPPADMNDPFGPNSLYGPDYWRTHTGHQAQALAQQLMAGGYTPPQGSPGWLQGPTVIPTYFDSEGYPRAVPVGGWGSLGFSGGGLPFGGLTGSGIGGALPPGWSPFWSTGGGSGPIPMRGGPL